MKKLDSRAPNFDVLKEVKVEKLDWLWLGRIPMGKMTLLAGEGGVGKSLVSLDIAARVSAGLPWPDEDYMEKDPGQTVVLGSVAILSTEDDIADTIAPRLLAMGANPDNVYLFRGIGEENDFINIADHRAQIEAFLSGIPDLKLVIFDPLTAFLGRTDSHRDAEIRGLLAPFSALLAKYDVAGLMIIHLNKNKQAGASHRIMGSVGINNAARQVWFVKEDEEDRRRKLFLAGKRNLTQDVSGLVFTIVGVDLQHKGEVFKTCKVEWLPEILEVTADDEYGEEPKFISKLQQAQDIIQLALGDGPRPAEEVRAMLETVNCSRGTISAACRKERVIITFAGQGGEKKSVWKLSNGVSGL